MSRSYLSLLFAGLVAGRIGYSSGCDKSRRIHLPASRCIMLNIFLRESSDHSDRAPSLAAIKCCRCIIRKPLAVKVYRGQDRGPWFLLTIRAVVQAIKTNLAFWLAFNKIGFAGSGELETWPTGTSAKSPSPERWFGLFCKIFPVGNPGILDRSTHSNRAR